MPVEPQRLAAAYRRMGRRGWAYVAGSAGQQGTARANEAAFARYRLLPRMLRDVAVRDLSVDLRWFSTLWSVAERPAASRAARCPAHATIGS